MKILWLDRAADDLDRLFDVLLAGDPRAALRTYQLIRARIGLLGEYPHLGRTGRVVGTRELVIPQTPYVVAYTVDSALAAVVILRVLHGARLWPEQL